MQKLIAALSLALLLTGCENTISANVTQFTALGGPTVGRSFAVVAEQTQNGSLEFNYYAGLVGGALQEHGLTAAPVGSIPDLLVQIKYGSAGNHTEIYGDPYGWGGGWGGRHRGWWGPDLDSVTYYGESLEVQIFDGAAWRNNVHSMVYQGRAVGDSRINDVSSAIPALVKALFAHFPGNSGTTERVVVPVIDQRQAPVVAPNGAKTAT